MLHSQSFAIQFPVKVEKTNNYGLEALVAIGRIVFAPLFYWERRSMIKGNKQVRGTRSAGLVFRQLNMRLKDGC